MMLSSNARPMFMPDETRLDIIPKLLTCDLFSSSESIVLRGLEQLSTLCYDTEKHTSLKNKIPEATTKEEQIKVKKLINDQYDIEMNQRIAIRDFGGHLAIVVCMKQWSHSALIQSAGCRTYYYASTPSHDDTNDESVHASEAFQDLAVHVGAMEVCLSALRSYGNIEQVQLWGCKALLHIGWCERNYNVLVRELHGVETFICAMNTYPNSGDIQRVACQFLERISRNDSEIREIIAAAGGRRVLLAAIENHPEHEIYSFGTSEEIPDSIQKNARHTMKYLCEPTVPKPRPDNNNNNPNSNNNLSGTSASDSNNKSIGSLFKKINLF